MEAEDQEEVVIMAVKELKRFLAKSVRSSEWSLVNSLLYYRGKVYVPRTELRCQILTLCHNSKLAGHPGRWKTLELVSRNYWWPQMSRYIGKYVSTCDMCLQTKSIHQPPSGELYPLPILNAPWDTASVNFIMELPESNGKDAIMVIVDSVTKLSHFVSTVTTLSTAGTAQLYLRHIWKHHGLPKRVVPDRGPQFVTEFTRELYQLLGVKLAATTMYHPQGDGQTERINQELEQFLRLFINQRQDDWDNFLPFVEFQYNDHINSATQNVPFFLDTGQIPHMGFRPDQRQSHVESINEFKERMEDALNKAKVALVKSKDNMAKYYDWRRTLLGDELSKSRPTLF